MIGAGIFGLVTAGMYDNPLAIYREYVQNSTDAIAGMAVSEGGKVVITVDPSERRVKIWDNGPGLSYDDCLQQLMPIGRSNKQMGSDRGFRGIGRLAGLAFAETVTFTTRARRNELVTRVTWNSSRLPSSAAAVGEFEDVVRDCVDVETLPGPGCPDHFFEVEMGGVARHAAGSLLNRDAVRTYVSEVCPVPMSPAFRFFQRVEALFAPNDLPMSLHITMDGDLEPVKRPFGESVHLSANRLERFTSFEELHIPSLDRNGDAAVGWIAHSSYLGAIPKDSRIRGIRARVGNIQIGDDVIFDGLYAEERFNRWCVGEIHILDHRIVPNARRDYFEPGPHLRNLENHLIPALRRIGVECRMASAARNRARKLVSSVCSLEEAYELAVSGYLAYADAKSLVQQTLQQIPSVRESMSASNLGGANVDSLDRLKKQLTDFNSNTMPKPFSNIPSSHIDTYHKIFQALATVSSSPGSAKEMMVAILEQTSDSTDSEQEALS